MGEVLRGYDVSSTTWFYLSLPLIIAIYFRFMRVWSLRNLDLTLLLLLSPSVLLVRFNHEYGQTILFAITGILLVRLFIDGALKRRPHLQPNLNTAGLVFLGVSVFAFLMTIAAFESPSAETIATVRRGKQLLDRHDATTQVNPADSADETVAGPNSAAPKNSKPIDSVLDRSRQSTPVATAITPEVDPTVEEAEVTGSLPSGPASSLVAAAGLASSQVVTGAQPNQSSTRSIDVELIAARATAIFLHCAVIAGLLIIGRNHFADWQNGLSMATLYLLIPCTSYDVSAVNHVLPPALILWAFVFYRKPVIAGIFMGLACGTLLFPIFLIPLWIAYYGKKQALRFGTAVASVAVLLVMSIAFISVDLKSFMAQTVGALNWNLWGMTGGASPDAESGLLQNPNYTLPIFACYLILLVFLTVWPRQKKLEHLMSHSAALIVGTQFWYPQHANVYVLWYLPLLLLVMFRPTVTQIRHRHADSKQLQNVVPPKQQNGKPPLSAGVPSNQHLFR